MLRPEDFRRQLNQTWERLVEKSKEARKEAQSKEKKKQEERIKLQEGKRQKDLQRKKLLLEIDNRLQIGQYLDEVRKEVFPQQKVKRWVSENDELIAYSLIFNEQERKIQIGRSFENNWTGKGPGSTTYHPIYGIRKTWDEIGIVLNCSSQVRVCVRRCAENSDYNSEKENPIDWLQDKYWILGMGMETDLVNLFRKDSFMSEKADDKSSKWYLGEENTYDGLPGDWLARDRAFLLTAKNDQKRFMKALTDFSVIVKAGWID